LPGMLHRRRGLILKMGSFAGLVPSPLLATYSGSKAFLQYWSTSLGYELEPHGISVQLVQSYLVMSAMSKIRRPSLFVPKAQDFVAAVLRKIGRTGGAQGFAFSSTPYWSHGLMQWGIGLVGFTSKLATTFNGDQHRVIRAKALKKQAREEAKALKDGPKKE